MPQSYPLPQFPAIGRAIGRWQTLGGPVSGGVAFDPRWGVCLNASTACLTYVPQTALKHVGVGWVCTNVPSISAVTWPLLYRCSPIEGRRFCHLPFLYFLSPILVRAYCCEQTP